MCLGVESDQNCQTAKTSAEWKVYTFMHKPTTETRSALSGKFTSPDSLLWRCWSEVFLERGRWLSVPSKQSPLDESILAVKRAKTTPWLRQNCSSRAENKVWYQYAFTFSLVWASTFCLRQWGSFTINARSLLEVVLLYSGGNDKTCSAQSVWFSDKRLANDITHACRITFYIVLGNINNYEPNERLHTSILATCS